MSHRSKPAHATHDAEAMAGAGVAPSLAYADAYGTPAAMPTVHMSTMAPPVINYAAVTSHFGFPVKPYQAPDDENSFRLDDELLKFWRIETERMRQMQIGSESG